MMLQTAWILARKDLRIFLRDRTALLMSIALPLFLATIFGAAMGGMTSDSGIGKVKLFVEDLDKSDRSRALVAELEKTDGLSIVVVDGARERVADGKGPAALVVPSGYAADVALDRASKLVLYRDPGQIIEQQVIAGNLMPALFRASGRDIGRSVLKHSLSTFGFPNAGRAEAERILDSTWDSIERVAVQSELTKTPEASATTAKSAESKGGFDFANALPTLLGIEVEDVAGGADKTQKAAGQSHAVSGIAVMMLLFGLTACGGTILEEEALGTLQRLRLSPSSGRAILAGKFLFTMVVGLAQLAILFVYGALVFHVPTFRAPIAVIVLSIAVASAATGLGLFLAVACRSRKQLEGLSTLVILAMSALGGSWFPLIMTPAWYQKLGHFTLNAWAMDGYQGLFWYGKDIGGIAVEIGVLFAIAIVTTFLARRLWTRRFEVVA